MMKLLNGVRTDSGFVISLNFILYIWLIFTADIFPQIPVNGFCRYKSFNITAGYNRMYTLNFNRDFYVDMFLFNPLLSKTLLLIGDKNGELLPSGPNTAKNSFNMITGITSGNKRPDKYAITSRINRKLIISRISPSGNFQPEQSFNFDSYPEYVHSEDADADLIPELLIGGPAFKGLSLMIQKNSFWYEKKIVENSTFSHAVFADLNGDEFKDIIAFDLPQNSLRFFYNKGNNEFYNPRNLHIDKAVSKLESFNFNLDDYPDIIFSAGKSINILAGDINYSFENILTVSTDYEVSDFILGDFNKDGTIDFIYLNNDENICSLILNKGNGSFYPEKILLKKPGLTDIVPFYSRFVDGFAALSEEGKIYTITNFTPNFENVSVYAGTEPAFTGYLDVHNNGIIDLFYFDNADTTFNIIERNAEGVPFIYYSYRLFDRHLKILTDDNLPGKKNFYFFTPGSRLVEILNVDLKNQKHKRNQIYLPGPVQDVLIRNLTEEEKRTEKIYIAYEEDEFVSVAVYTQNDFRFSESLFSRVSENSSGVKLVLRDEVELYSWETDNSGYRLIKYELSGNRRNPDFIYSIRWENIKLNGVINLDLFNTEEDVLISFFSSGENYKTLISTDSLNLIYENHNLPPELRIKNPNQLFFGEIKFNGLKRLMVFLPEKGEVRKLSIFGKGKRFYSSVLFETESIKSFFVKNMDARHYHLVYIDKNENCIKIKEI
ncbi:MAG: hypothetical protein Kow0098_25890 [Ignavibacteriaceae bacterium]